MGNRSSGTALRNLLAACYAVTVVIVGGLALFFMAGWFNHVADQIRAPDPDVIQFLKGEW